MPALMPTPAKANTPVMGMEPPMTMSSPPAACAMAVNGVASVALAASSSERRRCEARLVGEVVVSCMVLSPSRRCGCARIRGRPLLGRRSIAERPQVEKAANAPPHFCEPLRLEHQKSNDQQAEDDGAHR